ncbi:3-hexulose-6-phosphate synthase [Clostridiales bacterium COT073_COT-073]|nr:3-hexulose-6-phosphate synthase [Clostridiales bacterium COT073_COT-073]
MKLQIALDDISLTQAIKLIDKVRDYIDIVEVGTPMVMEYGMTAVRTIKEKFPELELLADLKIMDGGFYEASQAFSAGADYITVLAVTDNLTIKACVEAASNYKGQVVADTICVEKLEERILKLEEMGVDFISVHVGVDQQVMGRTPLDDLKIVKQVVKTAKVSVAGGINLKTMVEYKELEPQVIIIGSAITHAKEPIEVAKKFHELLNSN